MKKYACKIRAAALVFGIISTSLMVTGALADDQIRLNPAYKAPIQQKLPLLGEKITSDDFSDDFIQFLNPHDEDDQYILLTDPKERSHEIVTLGVANEKSVPLFQVNYKYQYNPSMLFNLPSTSSAIGGNVSTGLTPRGIGGSQVIISLNPSKKAQTPFRRVNSIQLMLGSSFINVPTNRYTTFLNNGYISPRAYNFSLGLGYSGFNLGASYSRNDILFSSNLSGFDLDFGYRGNSWSANVKVGEYNSNRSIIISQNYNLFDTISAYEVGAAYGLFSNVNLTGRFTYYSYGIGNDVAPLEDVKSLIFGTNVSF
ncbi:MAG: hypothetical protein JKY84_03495 [Emcibacteraceae bacterium]|nr:hypothetical protein [Emcibacteraceae bacterium]